MEASTSDFMLKMLKRLQDLQTRLFTMKDTNRSLDIHPNVRLLEEGASVLVIHATAFFEGKCGEKDEMVGYDFLYGNVYSFWDEEKNDAQYGKLIKYLEIDDNI